jgi:hypothetical protein
VVVAGGTAAVVAVVVATAGTSVCVTAGDSAVAARSWTGSIFGAPLVSGSVGASPLWAPAAAAASAGVTAWCTPLGVPQFAQNFPPWIGWPHSVQKFAVSVIAGSS